MPACLACGQENLATATVCVHCHRSLVTAQPDSLEATPPKRPTLLEAISRSAEKAANHEKHSLPTLVFHLENVEEPIIVNNVQQVIVGRCTPEITTPIGLDLEKYRGAERGVSRTHAAIRCLRYGMEIEDLASTNGTWLNGEKIPAFMPRSLRSGDHVRLGLLEITIVLRLETHDNSAGPSRKWDGD